MKSPNGDYLITAGIFNLDTRRRPNRVQRREADRRRPEGPLRRHERRPRHRHQRDRPRPHPTRLELPRPLHRLLVIASVDGQAFAGRPVPQPDHLRHRRDLSGERSSATAPSSSRTPPQPPPYPPFHPADVADNAKRPRFFFALSRPRARPPSPGSRPFAPARRLSHKRACPTCLAVAPSRRWPYATDGPAPPPLGAHRHLTALDATHGCSPAVTPLDAPTPQTCCGPTPATRPVHRQATRALASPATALASPLLLWHPPPRWHPRCCSGIHRRAGIPAAARHPRHPAGIPATPLASHRRAGISATAGNTEASPRRGGNTANAASAPGRPVHTEPPAPEAAAPPDQRFAPHQQVQRPTVLAGRSADDPKQSQRKLRSSSRDLTRPTCIAAVGRFGQPVRDAVAGSVPPGQSASRRRVGSAWSVRVAAAGSVPPVQSASRRRRVSSDRMRSSAGSSGYRTSTSESPCAGATVTSSARSRRLSSARRPRPARRPSPTDEHGRRPGCGPSTGRTRRPARSRRSMPSGSRRQSSRVTARMVVACSLRRQKAA